MKRRTTLLLPLAPRRTSAHRPAREASSRILFAWLLWLALPGFEQASAQQRPRVLVVTNAEGRPLAERVRAELDTSGFDASVALAQHPESPAQLAELARSDAAALAVWLRSAPDRTELVVYDSARAETMVHALDAGSEANAATLAIRIVELFRANLLAPAAAQPASVAAAAGAAELPGEAANPPPETLDKPAAAPAPAQTRPSRAQPPPFEVPRSSPRAFAASALGLAVLASPGGLGPGLAFSVTVGAFVARNLRLGVFSLVPLTPMKHSAAEGSSKTRAAPIGLDLAGEFFRDSAFRTSLAGGVAVVIFATDGQGAAPNYADLSSRRANIGGYLRSGLAYHFTRALALRGELTVGAQLAPFAVDYAGRSAARWGLPWLAGAFALEKSFP